eukprot:TRINITY_DN2867_c0_g1_i2.p2 TRINITY_DN2867_c0_g1~~TRINITY_DN2867_c0_g1_i2.p2  ORF type:complete len:282 (-),score=45.66 TRINITY_DN2867_c0_g1_i2:968-1813(-)
MEALLPYTKTLASLGHDFQWKTGVTPFSQLHEALIAVAIYLATVYTLQWFMKDKQPMKLRALAIIHNLILSVGSLVVLLAITYYVTPWFWRKGAEDVVCDIRGDYFVKGPVNWWMYVFYLSKVYEFLDTIILVLRKKQVIFLHVYHHCITLLLVWSTMQEHNPVAWADITANCFVHVIMYFYYFLCEFGIHPWWKKYITSSQIFQFCWDLFWHNYWLFINYRRTGTLLSLREDPTNKGCAGTELTKLWSDYVIVSFLLLFIQFYRRSYTKKPVPVHKTKSA